MSVALPVLATLFLWWFSTGAVLWLVGLPRRTFPFTILGAAMVAVAALAAIHATRDGAAGADAFIAFAGAVLVWAFVEVLFLTGAVVGPRRGPCPAGAAGFPRAVFATEAILWHEFALVACGALVAAAAAGGANPVALWTFLLLWAMRLSAKLNLFLGVPILNDGFLPEAVRHLRTYFRRAPPGPLYPVSVALSLAALAFFIAAAGGASEPLRTGFILLATLAGLGLVEHAFMALPVRLDRAFGWGLRSRGGETVIDAALAGPRLTRAPSPSRRETEAGGARRTVRE